MKGDKVWEKKLLVIGFLLLISLTVNAGPNDPFTYSKNFTAASGTDLNAYDTNWTTTSNTTNWKISIQSNQLKIDTNTGAGSESVYRLNNNDINLNFAGQQFKLLFTLINMDHNAIPDVNHQAKFRLLASTDLNLLVSLRIDQNNFGNTMFLSGGTSGDENNFGTVSPNDQLGIVLTRQSQSQVYDINFIKNGQTTRFMNDKNLNTNSIRFEGRFDSSGSGGSRGSVIIDDFNISKIPLVSYVSATVSYSNFYPYGGLNYVKDLNYSVSYSCSNDINAYIQRSVNDVNASPHTMNCDMNTNNIGPITYTHATQGYYGIKIYSVNDTNDVFTILSDTNFISDLNAPVPDLNFGVSGTGFYSGTPTVTAYLTCDDTISPVIDYNLFNVIDINLFSGIFDANSTQSVVVDANTGSNTFKGRCTDLVRNTATDTNTVSVFSNCYSLVDESTGVALTTGDVNAFNYLTARGYDSNTTFNFKSPLATSTCYRSTSDDTVRFDLNYADGTNIYREFNLTILQDINTTIPVCVADPQDFFEQLFTASQEREVVLYSILGHCYNLADYTKYALQDSLSHRAFTISLPYQLNTDQNNQTVILALINGAVEATINLDVLVFKNQTFETGLQPDELSIALYVVPPLTDSNTIAVYYNNLAGTNTSATIKIYDTNSVIYTQTISTTPNAFTLYFDTTTYDINAEVLKIEIVKTLTSGETETITRYFTLSGSSSSFPSGLGIIFSFVVVLFGLTLMGWSKILGPFGLLIIVAGIAILAFSPASPAIVFLQGVLLIAGVFMFMIYKDETVRQT